MAVVQLNGFALELSLSARRDDGWIKLTMERRDSGYVAQTLGIEAHLKLSDPREHSIALNLRFTSPFRTRLRLMARLLDQCDLFHLIPGNIHGDNNAAHVRPGEFPC